MGILCVLHFGSFTVVFFFLIQLKTLSGSYIKDNEKKSEEQKKSCLF
jgi:hypothetical protein